MSLLDTSAMKKVVAFWKENPVEFVRQNFRVEPQPWQIEALNYIASGDRLTVRSGHGVGKTALDAWVIIWFISTRMPCKVLVTAPSMPQLRDVLWMEIKHWIGQMPGPMAAQYQLHSSEQDLRLVLIGSQSFATGRTARKESPESLQGFHSPNLLVLADEGSGIEDIVYEVIQGALSSPNSKCLITSNPTKRSGYFYETHTNLQSIWKSMRVGCHESTLMSPTYIEEVAQSFGIESNAYRIRVMGEFPIDDDDALFPQSLLEAATRRDIPPDDGYEPVWGLDVARFGDDQTALCKRRHNELLEPVKTWKGRDTMEVTAIILNEYETSSLKPSEIIVDAVGLGAGVYDRLRELGLPARAINVGESPSAKDRYRNLRAELYWRAREWFSSLMVKIPEDTALIVELSRLKYKSPTGKLEIEKKEDMKKRGLKSPDRSDAFVLTFAGLDRRGVVNNRYFHNKKHNRPSSWITR